MKLVSKSESSYDKGFGFWEYSGNIVELFKRLGLRVLGNLKRSFRKVEKEIWKDYFKNGKAFDETFLKVKVVIFKVEVGFINEVGENNVGFLIAC